MFVRNVGLIHPVISQKIVLFITTAVRTSNPTRFLRKFSWPKSRLYYIIYDIGTVNTTLYLPHETIFILLTTCFGPEGHDHVIYKH
jgi:hypothetical protein